MGLKGLIWLNEREHKDGFANSLLHGCQDLIHWDGGEVGGVIGHGVREDELTIVDERAAAIDNIWHVAFALGLARFEQRFAQAAKNARGIIEIEQERANAILAHWPYTVAEH